MQFEATRTDPAPDADALRLAERHARHACGLDPGLAEAWATLGFVPERTGRPEDALAVLKRAVTLEPDNWRHQVRLALGSWGETRLRAARAALKRCPQLPMAHWLAATVFVSRHALDQAERDVDLGLAVAGEPRGHLYGREIAANAWYAKGACCLTAGDRDAARAAFGEAIARVPLHPMAHAGRRALNDPPVQADAGNSTSAPPEPRHPPSPKSASVSE